MVGGILPCPMDELCSLLRIALCQAAEVDGLLDDGGVPKERKGDLHVTILPRHPAGKKPLTLITGAGIHVGAGTEPGCSPGFTESQEGTRKGMMLLCVPMAHGTDPPPGPAPFCGVHRGKLGAWSIRGSDHSGCKHPHASASTQSPPCPIPGKGAVPRAGWAGWAVVPRGVRAAHVMAIGDPEVVIEA